MPLLDWLQLSLTDGLGPVLQRRLIEATGSATAACRATVQVLRSLEGVGSKTGSKIHESLREAKEKSHQILEICAKLNISIICREDENWPPLLQHIPDPPAVLFMRGNIEPRDLHSIAIVGSRKCSFYGREQAERFGRNLAASGITVISGGARGIDSSAHRGALTEPEGRTIAVLGCGLDIAYPPENKALFDEIASGRGAVLSEHPPGTPPIAEHFPRRNRIVSGMSRGVLVVEADVRSGALITARQAIEEHGRPVFAIPGRVDNALSIGPHQLIRDGATLVTGLNDILDDLPPFPEGIDQPISPLAQSNPDAAEAQEQGNLFVEAKASPAAAILSARQKLILENLEIDPTAVDTLIERTQLAAPIILQELTMLSLKGLIQRIDGQTYAKRTIAS